MGVREPTRTWTSVHADSRVWNQFERRSGDIIISTPPKSGTTWMQGIAASLLWPDREIPGVAVEIGPWLDIRRGPEFTAEVLAALAAQGHRRFVKTHSPADAIPLDDECYYITVYRDIRDVTMSWANHRTAMSAEFVSMLNELAAGDSVTPVDPIWNGDFDVLIDELDDEFALTDVLVSWWGLRDQPNVLFVHYNDLSADLEGEMRRIAEFLDQPVPDERWPEVVDRCRIDRMRESSRPAQKLDVVFSDGADSFFNRGTNGRWRGTLNDSQLERLATMTSVLPPDAAEWLQHGSLELGWRP